MSLYFFHITDGADYIADDEGLEQPDLAAVRKAAVEGASAMIAEAVLAGACDHRGRIDVTDGRGEQVLTLTFACPIAIDMAPAARDQAARPGG